MMHHRIRKIRNTRRSRRLLWLGRFRSDERGVQLVEVALVIPVMLLLFGAVAEFGRYFYEYTTAAKAVRNIADSFTRLPQSGAFWRADCKRERAPRLPGGYFRLPQKRWMRAQASSSAFVAVA